MQKHLLILVVLFATGIASAQLTIDNSVNATDGVEDVLLGSGITVSNISSPIGINDQIGSFNCVDCNLGIGSGLVMAGGNVNGAIGPNNTGATGSTGSGFGASDPDLSALGGGSLNDCVVIEFDFVPTGDSLAFNYVFGSEEYSEWLGYGDIFGFFLSGPGIAGPYSNGAINIATLPGVGTQVSVPNVNNGSSNTGPCQNCTYFNWNGYGSDAPYNSDNFYIQCDGFTTVLTANAVVQCGETYHIKLAIADQFDTSWDSFVFLEAGSFQSNQVELAYTPPGISPDASSLYEGCDIAWVTFTRPAGQAGVAADYAIDLAGTALLNVDFTGIPAILSFGVGQTQITLPVIALEDALAEGTESITITVTGTTGCTSVEGTSYTFSIVDVTPLSATLSDEVINCGDAVDLTPQISGGFGFYTVQWSTGDVGPTISVSPDDATTYFFNVTDTCGVNPIMNQPVEVSFPAYAPIVVDIGPDQQFTCLDDIALNSLVIGGYGNYYYDWEVNGLDAGTNPNLVYNTSDAGTISLTVTDDCDATDDDEMNFSFPPVPVNVNIGPDLDVTCIETTDLTGQVSGGIGAYTYSWTVNGVEQVTTPNFSIQVDNPSDVELIIEDECGNIGSDLLELNIPPVTINLELGADYSVTCIDLSTINPQISGGSGNYSYQWTTQNGVLSVDDYLDFQTDESITISLEVEDECGNTASDIVTLTVPQVSMSLDIGPNLTVGCTDVNLLNGNASGGVGVYTYSWEVNGQIQGLNPNFNLQTEEDATVQLTVEDECGNQISDELSVSVPPVPINVDIGPDLVVTCLDISLLNSVISGGVGNYSYSWSDGNSVLSINDNAQYQTSSNINIVLNVEDECGNINSDALNISVPAVPIFLTMPNDTAICQGQQVTLSVIANGGVGDFSYEWTGYDAQVPSISVAPGVSTTYSVSVMDECGNTSQANVLVGVEDVEPGFSVEYVGDWGIQLTNNSVNDESVLWYFADGTVTNIENPYHEFTTVEPWEITLVVIGSLGCEHSITETFYPLADIYVPNCFTPDGDGINDVFFAYGHDIKKFEMHIFSRWGDEIFFTNDITVPWDGSLDSGEYFIPDGTYSVMIKAEGIRGNFIERTTSVTVIR
ncbi:MAG: choice-of-anchor L domain-containing protein [Flavobacteriales bacterium]|nr:choice-of-anchor L domain-containing protein [Flavobacteriales bacterium]